MFERCCWSCIYGIHFKYPVYLISKPLYAYEMISALCRIILEDITVHPEQSRLLLDIIPLILHCDK